MAIHFILIVGHESDTKNYSQAITFPGYIPIVTDKTDLLYEAENNHDKTAPILSLVDLLILPGGGDISPKILGEANLGSRNIDEELDYVQLAYFQYFKNKRKPIIGICKGSQLINVALSGTLMQNMPPDRLLLHQSQNGFDNHHSCNYEISPQYPILEAVFHRQMPNYINSAHHQCIKQTSPELYAFMHASDGTIEGFIHREFPILGLQWHPERKLGPDGNYLKIYLYRLIKYTYNEKKET